VSCLIFGRPWTAINAAQIFLITHPNVFDTLDPRWHICIIQKRKKGHGNNMVTTATEHVNFFFAIWIDSLDFDDLKTKLDFVTLRAKISLRFYLNFVAASIFAQVQVLFTFTYEGSRLWRCPRDIEMHNSIDCTFCTPEIENRNCWIPWWWWCNQLARICCTACGRRPQGAWGNELCDS
jgi:hypothetical protein